MRHPLRAWLNPSVVAFSLFALPPALAADAGAGAVPDEGLALWNKVHAVFSHPRCANCHVGSDGVPVWSGNYYGPAPRPHGMHVAGGTSRIGAENGLLCTSCHAQHNAAIPHGPPGAPAWVLAPVQMQWFGRTSAQICAQVKDPALNGGRTLEQMAHHVEQDALVQWGWTPGSGREAAPYSSAETAATLRAWAKLGAPCPKS